MTPLFTSVDSNNRQLKRAMICLNRYLGTECTWAALSSAALTTRQIQLLQRGSDWMTPLGGVESRRNMIYMCVACVPNQGAGVPNGCFMTTSDAVVDQWTGEKTKLVHPKWKCPFCGAKYVNCSGPRGLMIDDRETDDDTGNILIFPLTMDIKKSS